MSSIRVFLVFMHGTIQNLLTCGCMPQCLGQMTLKHCKMMVEYACTDMCEYCAYSSRGREKRGYPHYISYYVTFGRSWVREVDLTSLFRHPRQYTYIQLSLPNPTRAHAILEAQVGKGMNYTGFYLNYVFKTKYGVRTEDVDSRVFERQQSWICAELFACILIDQGFGAHFHRLDPCRTRPYDLWDSARRIIGSQLLEHHPSINQQPLEERMDYPPGEC